MTARAAATTARGTSISSAALPGGPDGVPSISRTPPLVCSPKPPPFVTVKHQRVLIVQLIHLQTIDLPPGDWDAICTCVANFALKPFRCLSSPTITRPSADTAGGWNRHTFTVRTLLRIKNACPCDLGGFAFKDEYKEYFDVITGKTTVEGCEWMFSRLAAFSIARATPSRLSVAKGHIPRWEEKTLEWVA
jgi:hypothetical protein